MKYKILSFYKFVRIRNCEELQHTLKILGDTLNLRGTILIASEGINATISGTSDALDRVLDVLKCDTRFYDLIFKEAFYSSPPFKKWKVKVKHEILTFGAPEADPTERVGIYTSPREWNALLQCQDIKLIDTRNTYEISLGSFRGAINPQIANFREFKTYAQNDLAALRHKKIAMFCTGGIRCEKASSYLLTLGIKEVYHLEGGILRYLEEIDPTKSLWEGACFVFDDRISVKHGLHTGGHKFCRCGYPIAINAKECQFCKHPIKMNATKNRDHVLSTELFAKHHF